MGWLTQVVTITTLNLRTIPQRLGASVSAAVGIFFVVAVMVAVLSIAQGFKATLEETGSPDNVLVMRSGTDSEMSSVLSLEATRIIADAPGVLRTADGPVASAELFVIVDVPKRSTGSVANVPLRGVQPSASDIRGKVEIIDGRSFEPGRNELIAGVRAVEHFSGLEIGEVLRWGDTDWTVVGTFSAEGSASESELWCDVAVLQPAFRRGSNFQSVYAKLESPERFDEFKDSLTTDPRLGVDVVRENEYYASQSEMLHVMISGFGFLVAGLMGIGAVFGALNTMYSAVAARTREIATLRALGFGSLPVVISVLVESLVLSLAGGLAGGLAAYLVYNDFQATTLNWQSFSQVGFAFQVTPQLMFLGLAASVLMGLIGGLLPAVRAARISVATALREL